jgi:ankyrin repeat protein
MEAALEYKRKDFVDLLMGLGLVDNNPAALQAAVKDGNEDVVAKILDFGGNIHHVDVANGSLLQIAAANGHEKIASLLFEKGYNPNEPGCAIAPALTAAIRAKHNAIAKMLLQQSQKK